MRENGYTVTRQYYWHNGEYAVEIVRGSIDNTSPDALNRRYVGEQETYDDPRKAVREALSIMRAWQAEENEQDEPETIHLYGYTTGYGLVYTDEVTAEEALAWAQEEYERLPKCEHCGKPILGDAWVHFWIADEQFCSEYCAELAYAQSLIFDAEYEYE